MDAMMSKVVGNRWVALGVAIVLCAVLLCAGALSGTSRLRSTPRARLPAGRDGSVERAIARAERLLKAGRPREALKTISGVEGDLRQSAELQLVEGMALVALGESEPARQALVRAVAHRLEQPMAFKVLAAIAFSRGEEARGLEYLARAAALDPGDFRPLYAAGEVHLRANRMDAAIGAFEAALNRNVDHEESRIGLLAASLAIRPAEQLSVMVDEVVRDLPANSQVRVLAARHALAVGDTGSAMRHAERAIELNPDFFDAMVIRAHLFFMTGKATSALADATRAVDLAPRNAPALAMLAQLQAALGQTEASRATQAFRRQVVAESEHIRALTDQIAQHPDDPDPRWRLGQVAAATGARGLAIESYRAALALDDQCEPAAAGLRSLLGTSAPAARSSVWAADPRGARTAAR